MSKVMPLSQAVRKNLNDGDCAAFEGFTHLIPHAAGHEVIRQGQGPDADPHDPDIIYDQMIGTGLAKRSSFPMRAIPGWAVMPDA